MLTFLPTPIGNLEDITYRTISALKSAEIVFCEDTRVAKRLLYLLEDKLQIKFPKFYFISLHSHNEKEILDNIDISIFEKNCVYMSDAGMPGISDPGALLIRFCQKNSIKYDVLPGANAALVSYVMSGFLSSRFLFYGFLPHQGNSRKEALEEIVGFLYPVIVYESPHRIEKFFKEISALAPNADIFAIKEISKLHQKYFLCKASDALQELKKANKKGEWCIVLNTTQENTDIFNNSILQLFKNSDFPKKEASKILAKLFKIPPKKCYQKLI